MNGLLLVNLGSPASPTTADVHQYLQQFLSDRHVIEMPPALWQPLLRGIILPTRSWRSATFYQHIWTQEGSPLVVYTQRMAEQVQALLPDWHVAYAMTYGQPAIGPTLTQLAQTCDHIVLLPLFPQYTQSTHGGIFQQAQDTGVAVTPVRHFYDQPAYLDLLADQVWQAYQQADFDAVLFSYHSIPSAMVRHGDPYPTECQATTQGVLDRLPDLPADKVQTVYQSKFGPMPWQKPYLKNTLMQLVELGKRNVLIVTPSFVVDCLETLEEDYVQNYQTFKASGGDNFQLVPPMNDDPRFGRFLADLAQQQLAKAGDAHA
ncbi:MAG: ferrochelatase [Levilactobacillus sp.]|jgi:ferrochelatase|uniref:ferrochelatase n=1 Tax=Levilactobacillus sp. TaxID=2767919 RepID=UPI002586F467|nr:ferrochelatase [Levilactobacillus sp.]MCI1553228.1 ferrochelatase [Levilactobacillus sp.]MCI1599439.1 ferrochelatase [Levilactobacillus sp.]MCI1606929.1 ferrochelatase [Levilactobacillus sp.]